MCYSKMELCLIPAASAPSCYSSILEGFWAQKEEPVMCNGLPQLLDFCLHPSEVLLKVVWAVSWSRKLLLGVGWVYDLAKVKCGSWWEGRRKWCGSFWPEVENHWCRELLGDIAWWHQLPCVVISELMSCGKIAFTGCCCCLLWGTMKRQDVGDSIVVLGKRLDCFSGRRMSCRTALNHEPSRGSLWELGPHAGCTKGRWGAGLCPTTGRMFVHGMGRVSNARVYWGICIWHVIRLRRAHLLVLSLFSQCGGYGFGQTACRLNKEQLVEVELGQEQTQWPRAEEREQNRNFSTQTPIPGSSKLC